MSALPAVIAVGAVDARGVWGSSGVRAEWGALGVAPLGTGRTFRALFGRRDPAWRRLDRASRTLVLAAEAAGLAAALPHAARDRTALVVETALGCLDADLRFAACPPAAAGAATIFPATLPSAGLGELALRFGLRGAGVCLSVGAEGPGGALAEAARLLDDGDAPFVVAAAFDALGTAEVQHVPGEPRVAGVQGVAPVVSAVVVLLAGASAGLAFTAGAASSASIVPWSAVRDAPDPFALLAAAVRR